MYVNSTPSGMKRLKGDKRTFWNYDFYDSLIGMITQGLWIMVII